MSATLAVGDFDANSGQSAMMIAIVSFETLDDAQRDAAVTVLRAALAPWPSAFPTGEEARAETARFLESDECLAFAALEDGAVRGWIGAIRTYDHGWELHPLVVDPAHHGRGIGTRLVAHLEGAARAENVLTLYVGSDDEFGGTSAYGVDLYGAIGHHIESLAPVKGHPFVFYRKLGFHVVGLMPDVNGPGKPDIMMAKRL